MQIDALKGENLRVAVYHRVPIRVINQVSSYELIAKERRDYVERNGWTFLGIYIDEGQPGKGRERLMADCAAGKADLVLVRSMSKLDRDLPEVLRIADELASLPQPVGRQRRPDPSVNGAGRVGARTEEKVACRHHGSG